MVEAQSWTTRRMSNPRFDASAAAVAAAGVTAACVAVDIPSTPPHSTSSGKGYSSFTAGISPAFLTAAIIAGWFGSNIGVLLLNKYLLAYYGFRYPIFLTMIHMLSCSGYSSAVINLAGIVPRQHILSRRQFMKILALSAIFCFSVVCGNTSLRYIPVSFNQAIGATTPFFTAVFAFIITCKKESSEVYLALLPVVLGIVLASNSEPSFHLFGFLVCVGSTAGRALKSVVQGILLTSESEKLHSMNLLLYMAPMAACILLPFSLYIEGNVLRVLIEKAQTDPFIVALLVGNATVAYLVNLTNFLVTKHTSALTLQVLGNGKAAVAAGVSVMIFRNPVTAMGVTGFAVTVMGVVLYSEAKKRSKLANHK
ncbi:PREDICTED: probable sugar phosphate/phosphate translocator At1g12500 [Tarenaya hassleriana]|uniref:probable sugar phosphate/phosphate translocator At1g12500 n=1 Tax=Tarenaya hassleriana TaxID=28532 RepID=UPI00053C7448|nr:PREDICTED: probable sugar phosphate/phosphate translocator At1g12500 [Tarenaya hassleriana]